LAVKFPAGIFINTCRKFSSQGHQKAKAQSASYLIVLSGIRKPGQGKRNLKTRKEIAAKRHKRRHKKQKEFGVHLRIKSGHDTARVRTEFLSAD